MNATDNEVCEILRMKFSVPRETEEKLSRFHDLIIKWQSSINLISNTTREHIWRRHILDSAQLLPLIDDKEKIIADIGSGAGFPGLILSILGCKNIHLIESDARKSAFLREAARQVEAPITLHTKRVESLHIEGVNIITSRACASIQNLLE